MKRPSKIEHTFKTQDSFINYLVNRYTEVGLGKNNIINLANISFDFEVTFPINYNTNNVNLKNLSRILKEGNYRFQECEFCSLTRIRPTQRELIFKENCWFKGQLKLESRDSNLTIKNCEISDLNLAESKFGSASKDSGKLRIKSCDVYKTNFKNTTFHSLVDFYYTTFHENVIFYKTDFLNIVVLSATTFKKNLLFTYTLLNDKVIMRSTVFNKGFDFSLAIIKGHLAIFDLYHSYKNFTSVEGLTEEKEYEKAVSSDGIIPTQNKLETYRLLKVEFENQKNTSESLNFKLFEKKTLKKILTQRESNWKNRFDKLTLWLNGLSNSHGTSYSKAFVFIILVGWLFFYLSFISTKSFEFSINASEWEFSKGLGFFVQFLLPTHKFSYMGHEVILTAWFYVFDFLGRIFVGYGIYQFIQAFRKFK